MRRDLIRHSRLFLLLIFAADASTPLSVTAAFESFDFWLQVTLCCQSQDDSGLGGSVNTQSSLRWARVIKILCEDARGARSPEKPTRLEPTL